MGRRIWTPLAGRLILPNIPGQVFSGASPLVGTPVFGVDRALITNFWASEWKNGKLETNFKANIPMEMWVAK